jgi:hypothetical protein
MILFHGAECRSHYSQHLQILEHGSWYLLAAPLLKVQEWLLEMNFESPFDHIMTLIAIA